MAKLEVVLRHSSDTRTLFEGIPFKFKFKRDLIFWSEITIILDPTSIMHEIFYFFLCEKCFYLTYRIFFSSNIGFSRNIVSDFSFDF